MLLLLLFVVVLFFREHRPAKFHKQPLASNKKQITHSLSHTNNKSGTQTTTKHEASGQSATLNSPPPIHHLALPLHLLLSLSPFLSLPCGWRALQFFLGCVFGFRCSGPCGFFPPHPLFFARHSSTQRKAKTHTSKSKVGILFVRSFVPHLVLLLFLNCSFQRANNIATLFCFCCCCFSRQFAQRCCHTPPTHNPRADSFFSPSLFYPPASLLARLPRALSLVPPSCYLSVPFSCLPFTFLVCVLPPPPPLFFFFFFFLSPIVPSCDRTTACPLFSQSLVNGRLSQHNDHRQHSFCRGGSTAGEAVIANPFLCSRSSD